MPSPGLITFLRRAEGGGRRAVGGGPTIFLHFNSLSWSGAATKVGCGQVPLSKKMGIK